MTWLLLRADDAERRHANEVVRTEHPQNKTSERLELMTPEAAPPLAEAPVVFPSLADRGSEESAPVRERTSDALAAARQRVIEAAEAAAEASGADWTAPVNKKKYCSISYEAVKNLEAALEELERCSASAKGFFE